MRCTHGSIHGASGQFNPHVTSDSGPEVAHLRSHAQGRLCGLLRLRLDTPTLLHDYTLTVHILPGNHGRYTDGCREVIEVGAANPNFLWLLAFNAFLAYFTNLTNFLVGCPVTWFDVTFV